VGSGGGVRRRAGSGKYDAEFEKMSTFASAIFPFESRRYCKFMATFVYLPEKAGPAKSMA
jgi:hypothetical protein